MTDDLTRGFITRRLASDHDAILRDARHIAESWDLYVKALERSPDTTTSSEPVRLAEYTARLIQSTASHDAAREMAAVFLEDETR
ncbi:hypothetical protein GCM10010275_19340 [Streptomyces litmocidini]|uniref:hypothetical protein n=1 Tax=Streptomyces litmocidini TaxID=67318 RepID=UPI00167E3E0E|nr:hypothetical protein [Streptomyces litmocidini]GGU84418.1 hypothetical protein GCM10010275_19340 [Streptomyces litmocidini]